MGSQSFRGRGEWENIFTSSQSSPSLSGISPSESPPVPHSLSLPLSLIHTHGLETVNTILKCVVVYQA